MGQLVDMADRPGPMLSAPTEPAVLEGLTDTAHAERFAAVYGPRLRFNNLLDRWLVYRDSRWRADRDGDVMRLAMEFARARQRDALEIPNRELRERVIQFALKCESAPALERLIKLARVIPPINDIGTDWDRAPWLLGAPNGILDLRHSRLMDGDPAHKITMSVAVPYDEQARAPRWERFIAEIFDGDASVIAFVQRYCGYALTGLTTEQVLALGHGVGSNGKTVFLNVLGAVFGDYAQNVPFSTLELRGRSNIPNDVAVLQGKRLITASETNDGTRLNEARLKALTGSDAITARFLYSEQFTFKPVGKFILAVNHKPLVHDDSHGFWRRILLIPFLRRFDGDARDLNLEEKLLAEMPGILRWCVDGCRLWQMEGGLNPPGAVLQATNQYREDSDPLSDFLAECCDLVPGEHARASGVQAAYMKWADGQGIPKQDRLSAKALGQRMADRFQRLHDRQGWFYAGLRVATDRLFQ